MNDNPQKIGFKRAVPPQDSPLRDKDNAQPQPKPKLPSLTPANNKGPSGTKGVQENLPSREDQKMKPRFRLGERGVLKGHFKPIAGESRGKDHDRDI